MTQGNQPIRIEPKERGKATIHVHQRWLSLSETDLYPVANAIIDYLSERRARN